ncbi:MAG: hypothetical protein LUI60_04030, partial [Clostridia bacterium]|nr:hypothetical protein [Clostridia bacterium]
MKANKKKIARVFAYIFIAVLLVIFVCSMVIPEGSLNSYAESVVPTVQIVAGSTTTTSRDVTISVKNGESGVAYTIYYRTQNGSAIDGEHFDGFSRSVTLSAGESYTDTIDLKDTSNTKSDTYDPMNNYMTTYYSYTQDDTTHIISGIRSFICEIYYAESTSQNIYSSSSTNTDGTVIISSDKGSVTLNCNQPSQGLYMYVGSNVTGLSSNSGATNITYYTQTQWCSADQFLWTPSRDKSHKNLDNWTDRTYSLSSMTSVSSGFSSYSRPIYGYVKVPGDAIDCFNAMGYDRYVYIYKDAQAKTISGGGVVFFFEDGADYRHR